VAPETRILTSDLRWVRADSIKKGDKLIGFDENPPKRYGQRKFKESIVEDVGAIERPCYRVNLSDGTKVICSSEHQWLVFTAGSRTVWKMTKDLVPTDRVYKVCDVWDDLPQDYRLGYLAASFDGEGCLTQVNGRIQQLTFSQRDNSMLKQVKQYLEDFGFDYNADYADKRKLKLGQDLVYKLFIKGNNY
jgi:intein/homing endonuclease